MPQNINTELSTKIIELYQQGYSCKDICAVCGVPVPLVRIYLKEAGFDTRAYRKASEDNKNKILLLIEAGYPYYQIEKLLHTSTHLIREVVLNYGLVGQVSKIKPQIKPPTEEDISKDVQSALLNLYLSGEYGLAKCARILTVSDRDFLWFIFHLSDDEKKQHAQRLTENIQQSHRAGIPVTAIAKKMDISPAIVKRQLLSNRHVSFEK